MKNIIENKTCIIPYVVAQGAIWEVLERDYRHLTAFQAILVQNSVEPALIERGDMMYATVAQWRKGITDNEAGRDKLFMWFKHWAVKEIKKIMASHTH